MATYEDPSRPISELPSEFDNNKFMKRSVTRGDGDTGLVFKYDPLKEPRSDVMDSPGVKSFVPPKEKGKIPTLTESLGNQAEESN